MYQETKNFMLFSLVQYLHIVVVWNPTHNISKVYHILKLTLIIWNHEIIIAINSLQ